MGLKTKRNRRFVTIIGIIFIFTLIIVWPTFAQSDTGPSTQYPDFILLDSNGEPILSLWEVDAGFAKCIVNSEGEMFCCCEGCDSYEKSITATSTEPSKIDTPAPYITDTFTPTPSIISTPTPKEHTSCNRGIGNGSEDCDPGNSSEQGRGGGRGAGEDRGEEK